MLATMLYKSYFYRREFCGMLEEHAMEIVYGDPYQKYGEYTSMECMERGAFHTYYDIEENADLYKKMEDVWEQLHVRRWNRKFQRHYKVLPSNNDRKDRRKVFTFEYESEDGCWCSRERASRAIVIIDGKNLSMLKIKGVDPTLEQTAIMCLAAASHAAAIHEYNRGERVHPYKINSRIGYSGCEDYWLDIYRGKNNVFTKWFTAAKLHVSMAGKVAEITDMYVGDALELFTAAMRCRDFDYFKSKVVSKRYGVRFVRPYRNEILSEEDMDFIPKEKGHRRPSRRNVK